MSNPLILDGRVVAKSIEADLQKRVVFIKEKSGITPVLATIIVGNNPASETYVRMKGNACRRVGMEPLKVELPESTTTEELLQVIDRLNKDDSVCGILLQHPVPKHIDEQKCFNSISLEKDTDGVNVASFGSVTMGGKGFKCATPFSIMTILNYYGIELKGKHAVVIGRSPILGKPVSMLLLNADATVTICHSRTTNLPEIVKTADVVVACVGKANFVKKEWLKEGVVLVDAGYNEGNVGDIDLENCAPVSFAYTPVPGGVGPCTIAMLMTQTVESAERKYL